MATIELPEYVSGVDRNNPDLARAHLYKQSKSGALLPMCDYGWNRSDGQAFSILRGWTSARGDCKICERRANAGLPPIKKARKHKDEVALMDKINIDIPVLIAIILIISAVVLVIANHPGAAMICGFFAFLCLTGG